MQNDKTKRKKKKCIKINLLIPLRHNILSRFIFEYLLQWFSVSICLCLSLVSGCNAYWYSSLSSLYIILFWVKTNHLFTVYFCCGFTKSYYNEILIIYNLFQRHTHTHTKAGMFCVQNYIPALTFEYPLSGNFIFGLKKNETSFWLFVSQDNNHKFSLVLFPS